MMVLEIWSEQGARAADEACIINVFGLLKNVEFLKSNSYFN